MSITWSTLLAPIRLDKLANQAANIAPNNTRGGQKVNCTMYIQSECSRVGSQVRLVITLSRMKVVKVVRHADRVPTGMFLSGTID